MKENRTVTIDFKPLRRRGACAACKAKKTELQARSGELLCRSCWLYNEHLALHPACACQGEHGYCRFSTGDATSLLDDPRAQNHKFPRNKNGCTFFLLTQQNDSAGPWRFECVARVDTLCKKVRTALADYEREESGNMADLIDWAFNAKPGAPCAYYSALWIIALDPTQDTDALAEYEDWESWVDAARVKKAGT